MKRGSTPDLTGLKFGRLTVLSPLFDGRRSGWICRCDCGVEKVYGPTQLAKGAVVSCGCYRKTSKRKGRGESGMTQLLCRYRRTAKLRGMPFYLTVESFKRLTSSNCYYCGCRPQFVSYGMGPGFTPEGIAWSAYTYNGIDRVDNTKGYIEENCEPCCKTCNVMKGSLDQKQFLLKAIEIQQEYMRRWT